jgi:NAD+ kinase
LPVQRIGIIANLEKDHCSEFLGSLTSWLRERGASVLLLPEAALAIQRPELAAEPAEMREAAVVVVLGGDGTILRALRVLDVDAPPILGVNLGGLGFLTEVPVADARPALERVLAGVFEVEHRMMLGVTTLEDEGREGPSYVGLNDAVLDSPFGRKMLRLVVSFAGEPPDTYSADGIVIATPTGSTAYALAAGGPLLRPGLEALAVVPLCAHRLSLRPLVLAPNEEVTVHVGEGGARLFVDGHGVTRIQEGHGIRVTRSPHRAAFVRPTHRAFHTVLRQKLGWGGAPETGPDR